MFTSQLTTLACLGLVLASASEEASPISKVIKLVQDLRTEVETDAKKTAASYLEFAQFCKESDKTKTKEIGKESQDISSLSADIGSLSASQQDKQGEVAKRQAKQQEMAEDLTATTTRCEKQKAEFEASNSDMAKAVASLENAIKATQKRHKEAEAQAKAAKNTKSSKKTALIAHPVESVIQHEIKREADHKYASLIVYTLTVADAMGLVDSQNQHAVTSFLQGGNQAKPLGPAKKGNQNGSVKMGKEIDAILISLLKSFKQQKKNSGRRICRYKSGLQKAEKGVG